MTMDDLFADQTVEDARKPSGPVTCLGMTFENDEARRAHFTEALRKKLQDPEFRKIEGFPIGSDEDILNLSDPPYYTACPNPWIADFIAEWEAQKPEQPEGYQYHREPFAADVSEGKNDPIYNAHSYHTKVPHKAIMRYILHYTNPGDIVFDGFCGTGMTGVAAQLCGDRKVVMSLGYQVKPDGTILQEETDEDGKKVWRPFSKLGVRKAVLNDLSPAATFIAYNYNTPVDVAAFEQEAKRILKEVEEECGWMYKTLHTDGRTKGKINYTVWSDVFVCPECAGEVVFWDEAVDVDNGKVRDLFPCPHCSAKLTKRNMDRAFISRFDHALQGTIRQAKQVPVLVNYTASGKRLEKKPDQADLDLAQRIQDTKIPYRIPSKRLMQGQETRRNDPIGITHVHHFYTDRNLFVLAAFFEQSPIWLKWAVTGSIQRGSKQHQIAITRVGGSKAKEGGATAGHGRGTLYVPSNQIEMNAITLISDRVNAIKKALFTKKTDRTIIATGSTTAGNIPPECYDYFFFDPPFGANIAYSELNSLQEGWLGLLTNHEHEAIEDKPQKKTISDYHSLMRQCFDSAYKTLKPGRWMTVEFSNTSAGVWNVIQTALQEAGFIVANVSSLDKKRGGLNAIVGNTAVKQNLAISAYKPNGGFEERFQKEAQTEEGVWDFVRSHLKYLPVTKRQGDILQFVPERDPRILFDQMIAYYVRKGYPVPISSQEFQIGLAQRFVERDGMYFLADQVAEYDRKKMTSGGVLKDVEIWVKDEASAIGWLRQLIKEKPQTFSDINPQFMQQLAGWSKCEAQLDLRELLNQNFLSYDGKGPVPEQIHAYLSSNWKELRNLPKDDPTLVAKARDRWYVPDPNKAGDLEKLREKSLLKEFEEYKQAKKKLKVFRLEAVRAGFKKAWQERDYAVIVAVADKIPNNVLEEDTKLLMWYDQAVTRIGGE
ncbi:DNA methylase [Gammaproteobacteria bacterium]